MRSWPYALLSLAALGAVINDCQQCLSFDGAPWSDGRCPAGRNPLVGPQDYSNSLPHGIQCCATKFGDNLAQCETASCKENFGGLEYSCSNYGSPSHGSQSSCPYPLTDRAVCDVSYYILQNEGLNCRDGASGNCLGKVKCNSNGVELISGHSNGTANGGGGECASATDGFGSSEDCVYQGQTEEWNVCSHSSPKRNLLDAPSQPTAKPTKTPTTKPTHKPTRTPTDKPTKKPSLPPTARSTKFPTSEKPTTTKPPKAGAKLPTLKPTRTPTDQPTQKPTKRPTVPFGDPDPEGVALFGWPWWWPLVLTEGNKKPSAPTTRKPTKFPTVRPTKKPTTPKPTKPTKPTTALYTFALTGSRTAIFTLDSSPSPDFSSVFQFQINNVSGLFGTSTIASTISFGISPTVGDFEIVGTSLGFTQFSGPTLFTGTTSAPTFLTGTFQLSSIVSGTSTLTITALTGVGR